VNRHSSETPKNPGLSMKTSMCCFFMSFFLIAKIMYPQMLMY